ncbi:MAG: hypothetical protein K1Y02_16040 [Candidatus Hydrogenedentes bacterium]|nr:hypothetical protein [Candidatus Hydrogenedentota bacterium]
MFPPDKILHFWASFGIAWFSPALSFGAGIAKEVFDALGGGIASTGDLLADAFGILFARIASPWF